MLLSANRHTKIKSSTLRLTMMVVHFQPVSRSSSISFKTHASSPSICSSILPVFLILSTSSGLSEARLQLRLSRERFYYRVSPMRLKKSRLLQNFRSKLSRIGRHQFSLLLITLLSRNFNYLKKVQASLLQCPRKERQRSLSGSRSPPPIKCAKTLSLPKMKTKKKRSTTTSMMRKRGRRVRRRATIQVSKVATSRTTMTSRGCAKISSSTES